MRLVNPTTGAHLGTNAFNQHQFKWLAAEDGDNFQVLQAMQPDAGWHVVNGTTVLSYPSAMLWACHAGTLPIDADELRLQKRGLATATAITRVLRVVVAAILAHDASLALGQHTKGEFIARFCRAVAKLPQASQDECILQTADWASLADPSEAYEIAHAWIQSVTLGMLAEHGTRSAKRIGWLMYCMQPQATRHCRHERQGPAAAAGPEESQRHDHRRAGRKTGGRRGRRGLRGHWQQRVPSPPPGLSTGAVGLRHRGNRL